jgi:hypothetical protein
MLQGYNDWMLVHDDVQVYGFIEDINKIVAYFIFWIHCIN